MIDEERLRRILAGGMDRVVVNAEGEAVSPERAQQRGITPDVIFIRNDGWSLGAPASLYRVAEKMWRDLWVAMVLKPERTARPFTASLTYCDFCSSIFDGDCYQYPARAFYISTLDFASLGAWIACEECHGDIAAGKWDLVQEREAYHLLDKGAVASFADGHILALTFHNMFRAHRLKEPVIRITKEERERL